MIVLDKAIVGGCRAGYCRADVYITTFDDLVTRMENVPAKSLGGMDPALWYSCRWYFFRWYVRVPIFDQIKQRVKSVG